ncbi:MAG TPA: sulfatase [Tepidisphaeraceae bacterium]|jgi:arylsulfatase A-like enzyme|nr:sulfatase [Tepidisphaeraceae bacterium]
MQYKMGRCLIALGLILIPSASAVTHAAETPAAQRPNILYIMSDDHGTGALSCYGSKINKTPNLDRIASEGMRFSNCFCTDSLCGPSRAVLLTGKYNHLNGFRDNGPRTVFDGSQQTFPKLLQKAGYQTAIIGKWHLQSDPTGFDYWSILPGQGVYNNPAFITMGKKEVVKGYVTDIITDKVLDYLKNRDTSKPFCLLYHHKAPHRSWIPDEKHAHLYDDVDIPTPSTFDDDYSHRASPAREQTMQIDRDLTKEDLKADPPPGLTGEALKKWKYERFIKDYLRVIAALDDNVGRVLDYLDQSGLSKNTIVIYTSDNGFFLGDHGWFDKRWMYEESLHIPLLVRWPGHVKAGTVSTAIVSNLDFAETLLNAAGAPVPADMQGRSLVPLLENAGNPPPGWRTSFYYHYYEFPVWHHVQPHIGVRDERYKLIDYYGKNEWELFDLQKDPHELFSVYDDPAYAKTVTDMKAELARLREQYKDHDPLVVPFPKQSPGDQK